MTIKNNAAPSLIDPTTFKISYELVPGQGAGGRKLEKLLEFAQMVKKDGRITALSITDNAGGHPSLAPVAIGTEVQNIGVEPLIHFSLKDKNRNQIESHIFLYQRLKFNYVLVMGGDFPKSTWHGQAKPVYDLDTIQTIELVELMKRGAYRQLAKDTTLPINLQCGCVVSPFKVTEAEQVWQYAKLLKKIRAGAQFIITQLGFDMRGYEDLIIFLQEQKIRTPVLASIFIPSPAVAKIMERGNIPGVLVPQELASLLKKEGKQERLIRAAGMIAVLRGLGYSGVHIGGNGLDFDDIAFVLDQAEKKRDNWRDTCKQVHIPIQDKWLLYKKNNNGNKKPVSLCPGSRPSDLPVQKFFHNLLFSKTNPISQGFGRLCRLFDKKTILEKTFTTCEKITKEILFSCRMCGDCTLSESTYLCPQSGCPKKLVNGPCGGSNNDCCEVFKDKTCFFVRVYHRLNKSLTVGELADQPVLPPKDWALEGTSSWINFFLGRDHTTK
jgi:methylenetetrahydrofolate reductase (NADPH)